MNIYLVFLIIGFQFTGTKSFYVFRLFLDEIEEKYALDFDSDNNYLSILTKNKKGYIQDNLNSLLEIDLSQLNITINNQSNIDFNYFKTAFNYPNGFFSINSVFLGFELSKFQTDKPLATTHFKTFSTTSSIKNIKILDSKLFLWTNNNTIANILNISSIQTNQDLKNFFPLSEIPIFPEINLNNPLKIYNSTEEIHKIYLTNTLNDKIRLIYKANNDELLKNLLDIIEKANLECEEDIDEKYDIDFDIDKQYFLMICREKTFILPFMDNLGNNFTATSFYYKNFNERIFDKQNQIKIIESYQNYMFYSIYNPEVICYYVFEPHFIDLKYSLNRRIMCMRNSVLNSFIEDIYYNKNTKFINIIMRNHSDGTIFIPSFHHCVLNMKPINFICNICDSIFCIKQCEKYSYPGCIAYGEIQKNFFLMILLSILGAIIFLFCSAFYKNRNNFCKIICYCFTSIFRIFLVFPWIWEKRRFFINKFKCVKSYCFYWFKCGFKRLDEEQNCPICLENLNSKPKTTFACGRHEVHSICFNSYIENNLENNKVEGCPFRDA